MVFVVDNINIFCDVLFYLIFSVRTYAYISYTGMHWYNPSLVPPQK